MIARVRPQTELQNQIDRIARAYLEAHPGFIEVAIAKDAALKSIPREEVEQTLLTYPGVIAVAVHEVAHDLYKKGGVFRARELAEAAHSRTGIDIHPGTVIGENLFIDHGTGDVIGETAQIGRNTQIMHKVTLGAYTNPKERRPEILAHRHPEIGDDCFIGPGVEVLGNIKMGNKVNVLTKALLTGNNIVIGDRVRIGTGAEIEDGCAIAPGVKIGEGAFIHKDTGQISQNIPPHSQVFRDDAGTLHVVEAVPVQYRKTNGHGIERT